MRASIAETLRDSCAPGPACGPRLPPSARHLPGLARRLGLPGGLCAALHRHPGLPGHGLVPGAAGPGPGSRPRPCCSCSGSVWLGDRSRPPAWEPAAQAAKTGDHREVRGPGGVWRARSWDSRRDRTAIAFMLDSHQGLLRVTTRAPAFAVLPGQALELFGQSRVPRTSHQPGPIRPGRPTCDPRVWQGMFRADSMRLLQPPGPIDRAVAEIRAALEPGLGAHRARGPARRCSKPPCWATPPASDPAVMDDFRASGMLHILAISGQHIGLLGPDPAPDLLPAAPSPQGRLRPDRAPGRRIRAGMRRVHLRRPQRHHVLVRLPAVFWERPSRGVNNLALAACVCLVWMPYQILNLGFQLSFGATFFLILYSRPLSRSMARLPAPAGAAAVRRRLCLAQRRDEPGHLPRALPPALRHRACRLAHLHRRQPGHRGDQLRHADGGLPGPAGLSPAPPGTVPGRKRRTDGAACWR